MSTEEQAAATEDGKEELNGVREMKTLAARTVPVATFHDLRCTIEGIEKEVCCIILHYNIPA
jgi:hypothetical protein